MEVLMNLDTFFSGMSRTSKILLLIAAILLNYSIFCEVTLASEPPQAQVSSLLEILSKNQPITTITNPLLKFYVSYIAYIWYGVLLLVFIGTFKSFAKSFNTTQHLIAQLALSSFLAMSFLICSLFYVARLPVQKDGMYTVIIGIFSVMSVCIGWLINTQVSRRYQEKNEANSKTTYKRSHTLNLIIQLRLSKDIQNCVRDIMECYDTMAGKIPDSDVKEYFDKVASRADMDPKKYNAFLSSLFLIDVYEFICEGIKQGDLDEELIYDSLFGTMLRNRDRAGALIDAIRKGTYNQTPSPKALIELVRFTDKHRHRYEVERSQLIHQLTGKHLSV